jgi:3-hydroxy-9,10-secoandrosta-1,3,5(10)-triene-9,17-dione monooxygenase
MNAQDYLNRARALLPSLRERSAYAEALRRMPDETFNDMQEAGLFRGVQPRRHGGYELDPGIFFKAVIDIGGACGSSAWIMSILGVHNWQLGLFHPQAQEDVWGVDQTAQIASSVAPTGKIERVDGGYRISGRWFFSSGCDHCQWAMLGGIVDADEGDSDPFPDYRHFLVPRSDYTLDDNWHVIALAGTGSKDIVVENAVVPEYRTYSIRDAFHMRNPGTAVNPGPLFSLPFYVVFPHALVAPAIGIAQGVLHEFRGQMQARVVRDGSYAREDPFMQMRLAESSAEVNAAQSSFLHNFDEMMQAARRGQEITLESRARYRWEAAKATAWSTQAVDRLFEASGARALFLDNPMQRAWRDIHAIRIHAGNSLEKAAVIFGRSQFGLPPMDFKY